MLKQMQFTQLWCLFLVQSYEFVNIVHIFFSNLPIFGNCCEKIPALNQNCACDSHYDLTF